MQTEEIFIFIKSLSIDTKISLLSALAAVTSAIYAWKTYRETKKSIILATIDFDERHREIKPYLIDAIIFDNEKQENIVAIACSFHNGASAPNSIVKFELILHFCSSEKNSQKTILDPIKTEINLPWNLNSIPSPLNLEQRSTSSGWISFRIPEHIYQNKAIDTYQLTGIDSFGNKISIETHITRKIETEMGK